MKKKYYFWALASFMLGACSNENDSLFPDSNGGRPDGKTITFVFPGTAQGVVPYAGIATAEENKLETLDIYVFGEDSLASAPKPIVLKEVFRSGEFALTPVGDSYQATISVYPGAQRKFYFVANGRDNLSLDSLVLGVTDTMAFLSKATNTLKGHLACPLLMSGTFPESGAIEIPEGGLAGKQNVELTRRVARFDVLNWCEESAFKINKIVLKDVPGNNSIFAQSTPYTPVTIASLPVIDFLAYENNNYGESKSVFYLYPTTKTENIKLSLVGETLAGAPQVYNVEFKKDPTDVAYIPVVANNRYLLSVLNVGTGTLTATIEVTDWVVGDTINNEVTHGTIKLDVKGLAAPRVFADNTLTLEAEAVIDSITVDVAADEEWELVTDCDWIRFTDLPGDSVLKSFKIVTSTTNPDSKEARVGTVIVQNVKRPSLKQPLLVKQLPNTTSYIDLSGSLLAGNTISFSGEKTSSDSMNIAVSVPSGATWTAAEGSAWFNLGDAAVNTRAGAFVNNDAGQTGTGAGTFSIVADKNNTQNARQDTITVTISGVDGAEKVVRKIIVKQAAQNLGSIRLSARGMMVDKVNATNYNIKDVPADGFADKEETITTVNGPITTTADERRISVVATSDWAVEVKAGSWISISKDKHLTSGENGFFCIKAAKNETATPRTDTIKVYNTAKAELYKTIAVTQEAGTVTPPAAPTISFDQADYPVVNDGSDLPSSIAVTTSDSSTDWTVSTDADWLTVTNDGAGNITIAPVADKIDNTSGTERAATVTVTHGTNTSVTKTFTITQAGQTII